MAASSIVNQYVVIKVTAEAKQNESDDLHFEKEFHSEAKCFKVALVKTQRSCSRKEREKSGSGNRAFCAFIF